RCGISKSFPFPSDMKWEKYSASLILLITFRDLFYFAPPLLVRGGGFQPSPAYRAKARPTVNDRKPKTRQTVKDQKEK
ncbi:TPA: hypothetical protein ACFNMU_002209, partial [Neisseria lactamica]